MFDNLFINILNLSYVASFVIAFVLIARFLIKNKVPKIFLYLLWIPVFFKLVCPFSFESIWGLLPQESAPISTEIVYAVEPEINTGFTIIDDSINEILPASPDNGNSVNPIQIWLFIGQTIWITGISVLFIYSLISLIKLNSKLKIAMHLRDNIYIADHINSPFVIGIINPKIYLTANLSDCEQEYIIAHEQIHIKRLDHITRAISFLILTIHWFNPLVWLAFVLSSKDMEMSCDESVMNKMDENIKSAYSSSLLRFAVAGNPIHPSPLAFGESDTKSRVKNIMNYKKSSKITAAILTLSIIFFSIFLVSQKISNQTITVNQYDSLEVFTMSNVQNGEKISKTITDQEQISEFAEFFASATVGDDIISEEVTSPYYYQFYKNGKVAVEYIFQDNNYNSRYTDDGLKSIQYTSELSIDNQIKSELELIEAEQMIKLEEIIDKELEALQEQKELLEAELIEQEKIIKESEEILEELQAELEAQEEVLIQSIQE